MNLKITIIEQKKPVTEYPENKPTYVNFKTGKIPLMHYIHSFDCIKLYSKKFLNFRILFKILLCNFKSGNN